MRLLKPRAVAKVPAARRLAAEFRETVTFVPVPGGNVPALGITSSQGVLPPSAQSKEAPLEFVSTKVRVDELNGPPAGPFALKPLAGRIPIASGRAKALMRFWPKGVPQPVQRSKPVTARKSFALVLFVLLPVVMSWK